MLFDAALRRRTEQLAQELADIRRRLTVPPAQYSAKCRRCSLRELCMPRVRHSAAAYLLRLGEEARGAIGDEEERE